MVGARELLRLLEGGARHKHGHVQKRAQLCEGCGEHESGACDAERNAAPPPIIKGDQGVLDRMEFDPERSCSAHR